MRAAAVLVVCLLSGAAMFWLILLAMQIAKNLGASLGGVVGTLVLLLAIHWGAALGFWILTALQSRPTEEDEAAS